MHIHKPLVVVVDENPATVTLSGEVRTISKVELVYFRLMNIDLDRIPKNLFIRLDEISQVHNDQIVASLNTPVTASAFGRLSHSTVPLHFKVGAVYLDSTSTARQNAVLFGYQPEEMRWSAKDVSSMTVFKVTLVDFNGTPYSFGASGTTMELVFDAHWEPSQLQSQKWKTDRVYMNSMNS
jgi:hypothetical protein